MSAPEMPETIWATLNGMSTRLPDGKRQFVGGWSEDASRDRVTKFVRADIAERERAELVEVLRWYGENARLARLIHSEGDIGRHAISSDGGKRARALLSKLEGRNDG